LPNSITIDGNIITGENNILNAINDQFINISDFLNKSKFKTENFKSLEEQLIKKTSMAYFYYFIPCKTTY
jgi:hypothetical protein